MALQNTLVGNICYPDLAAAVDAYFSALPVTVYAGALSSYSIEYVPNAGAWNMQKTSCNSSGNCSVDWSVAVSAPAFPACDPVAAFNDGMAIGWGVAAAMFAALAVSFIVRAFFR